MVRVKRFLLDHIIELLLVLLVVYMANASPAFLKSVNVMNILRNISFKGVIAFGMGMTILLGEIDLSVGSAVALSAVTIARVTRDIVEAGILPQETAVIVGILCALGLCMAFGALHAWARTYFRMPSFIVTLASMNAMYGMAALICQGFPIVNIFPAWYLNLGSGVIFGIIPIPTVLLLVVFCLLLFIMSRTDIGRKIYAVGGNQEAARLNGISLFRTRLFVMMATQVLVVISSVMTSAQVRSATFTQGKSWETAIISSVVIGGISMTGGVGKIRGVLVGILFIGIISNGMTLLNVSEFIQYIVNGMLMFGAVMFSTLMTRRKE